MSATFKVGDWVTWGQGRRVLEVKTVSDNGYLEFYFDTGHRPGADTRKVDVRMPKPKRKLTPRAALAWLRSVKGEYKFCVNHSDAAAFLAWCNDVPLGRAGSSPTAAIIALRKALKVKP